MNLALNSTGFTRDLNRRLVLEAIRLHAPVARIEIAKHTSLTPATVTNIVSELIRESYVLELGRRPQGRGQPPVELDLNPDAAYTVGLHLDRDLLTGVLVDLKGYVRGKNEQEIELLPPGHSIQLLQQQFQGLISHANIDRSRLLGVGVVTVGPLDMVRGQVSRPPNFPGWKDVPLRQELANATGLPVFLDNNATAAAVGERWYGAGQHYKDFLYVYLGLGLGGGLVLNGRVHRGAGLNAGEIGHMMVEPHGMPCACGGSGCLETRVSLLALRRELGEEYTSITQIALAFTRRDTRLLAWLDQAAASLARAAVSVDNLLDLDAVIIGGRLPPEVLSFLVEHTRLHAQELRMRGRPRYASLEVAHVGTDAAALGAATLPVYDAFAPSPSVRIITPP